MTTEKNNDNIPRIRELFRDFEAEPPPQSWNAISTRLAGEIHGKTSHQWFGGLAGWFQPVNHLYPALAIVGIVLIALVIWIDMKPTSRIKGQALIDESELARGTAYLFRVRDRVIPYDSVSFFGKMELDTNGRFYFGHVPSGLYLLRIHVHPESQYSEQYNHGYYGDQLYWNNATLIQTGHPQESYVIRVPKVLSK